MAAAEFVHLPDFWKGLGRASLQEALSRVAAQLDECEERKPNLRWIDLGRVAGDDAPILQFTDTLRRCWGRQGNAPSQLIIGETGILLEFTQYFPVSSIQQTF